MSKRHEESTLIQTLQRELAEAKTTSHTGIQSIAFEFPEIVDLLQSVSDLIYAADARSGAITDGDGRGSGNTLSVDGLSTAAGRSTLRDRGRLDNWRKRVAIMARNMDNELDPNYKSPPRSNRQCGSPKCSHKWKRQPYGVSHCGYCGREFTQNDKSKKKTKTRLTLVKRDKP